MASANQQPEVKNNTRGEDLKKSTKPRSMPPIKRNLVLIMRNIDISITLILIAASNAIFLYDATQEDGNNNWYTQVVGWLNNFFCAEAKLLKLSDFKYNPNLHISAKFYGYST